MLTAGMNNASTYSSTATLKGSDQFYPIYHYARADVIPGFADKYTSVFAPFAAYWIMSLLFHAIDNLNWPIFERYRIHEPEEVKSKNRVTMRQVILAVLLQQVIQTALGLAWLVDDDPSIGPFRNHAADIEGISRWTAKAVVVVMGQAIGGQAVKRFGAPVARWVYWWGVPIVQFMWAAFVLDAWQYFWHRYFHTNKFLYRHVHSWHHRLYVPYAFGALYNHPLEGFILDTLGAVVAHSCAFMTTRQGIVFFSLSTAKTVDDHCGFAFPWDPIQHLFGNNSDFHDIHHQMAGLKANYSQPYFIHFDYFLNTRMTRAEFNERKAARLRKGVSTTSEVNGPNELAFTPTSKRNGPAIKEE